MKKILLAVAIANFTLAGWATLPANSSNLSNLSQQKQSRNQTVTFANGSIALNFPVGWYQNPNKNPFDLQYFSETQNMNTGIFLFRSQDLSQRSTPQKIFELQIDDLRSKRQNFNVLESETRETFKDKTITTTVFSGEKNELRYYYKFSLIEFKDNPEQFLITLQVAIPSQWNQSKPVLENIISSVKLVSSRER